MTNVIGPDVSFYQDDESTARHIDFQQMKANAGFVIIRAGQNEWPDPDFAYNWLEARQRGLPRGSYWFYDSRVSPERQAELWIKIFNGDLGELPLFADFEERYGGSYGGWKNFKAFLERLKVLAPGKEIGIYTGFYYWEDVVPAAERAYFKQYLLWIANYGVSSPKVPDPWADDEWLFWQYTDKGAGATYGAESHNIDLNVFHGDLVAFNQRFQTIVLPPSAPARAEVHLEPYPGVKYHEVFRFGSWCYVLEIPPAGTRRFAVTEFGLKTVSQVQRETGAHMVINGGDFNSWHAVGLHVVNGVVRSPQVEYEPCVHFGADHRGSILPYDSRQVKFNSIAGKRFIVSNGAIAPNRSAAWREVHPRTLIGVAASGTVLQCIVDGRQPGYSRGVDLYESAEIMIEFGAQTAIDLDGGGSSTMSLDGRIVNSPIDQNIPGKERLVGDHILAFIDGAAPPEPPVEPPQGDSMIVIKPINSDTRLRVDHNTFARVISSYGPTATVEGDEIWTAPANGEEVKAGDKWLHVTRINNTPMDNTNRWMAIIHKGAPICTIVSDDTTLPPNPDAEPDPPEVPVKKIVMSFEVDETVPIQVFINEDEWIKKP